MNVASLDLCKELFELSGWEDTLAEKDQDTYFIWVYSRVGKHMILSLRDGTNKMSDFQEAYPAYDLGYLLRKLLPETPVKFIEQSDGRTLILWNDEFDTYQEKIVYADTPEDAACKLAIELFKQGVLSA